MSGRMKSESSYIKVCCFEIKEIFKKYLEINYILNRRLRKSPLNAEVSCALKACLFSLVSC